MQFKLRRAQLTVAFCAVDVETLGSCETLTIWPVPPPVQVPAISCQQGAAAPFDPQYGTVESIVPPLPFDVWLMTVQSGSVVPVLLATVPGMQGGTSAALIRLAICPSEGAKLVSQIDSTRPLVPNSLTRSVMRMAGSA